MTTALDKLIEELTAARKAATMENMSLGFDHERIVIKSAHFPREDWQQVGAEVHPTDYVRDLSELYRRSWIIGPLDRALGLLTTYRELIQRCDTLANLLRDKAELERIEQLARGATKRDSGY